MGATHESKPQQHISTTRASINSMKNASYIKTKVSSDITFQGRAIKLLMQTIKVMLRNKIAKIGLSPTQLFLTHALQVI